MKGWQKSNDTWLPGMDRTVCHREVRTNGSKCLKAAETVLLVQKGKYAHPQHGPQAKISANCTVIKAEIVKDSAPVSVVCGKKS
jgi:hypothetical protein